MLLLVALAFSTDWNRLLYSSILDKTGKLKFCIRVMVLTTFKTACFATPVRVKALNTFWSPRGLSHFDLLCCLPANWRTRSQSHVRFSQLTLTQSVLWLVKIFCYFLWLYNLSCCTACAINAFLKDLYYYTFLTEISISYEQTVQKNNNIQENRSLKKKKKSLLF